MFDNILRAIWAILTISFVGLIFYFRKPLKSVLDALSDMDLLKAGPLEFKRRQQDLKKVLEPFLSKIRIQSKIDENQEEIISSYERECLSSSAILLLVLRKTDSDPDLVAWAKSSFDHYYKIVKAKNPDSGIIALCDDMIRHDSHPPVEESPKPEP